MVSIPDKTGLVHPDHGMVGDHKRHPSKIPEKLYNILFLKILSLSLSLYVLVYYTYNNRYFQRSYYYYLRTQSSLFMERASNEHAILWCGNFALTSDPNATRMTYHFADHVFSCMAMSTRFQGLHIHLTSTDRPFGDVIWPDIGGHRGRRFTKPLR